MFKRISLILALFALLTVMTGCFHQRIIMDSDYNASKTVPDYQATYFHILGFIGIGNEVDLSQVCPGGTGLVERKELITINALTIEQMGVYCK